MPPFAIESLGFLAAAISCSTALPQLAKIWKTRDVTGVAAGTWWLTLLNATLWLVWAIGADALAAGIPSLINGPMAIVILYKIYAAKSTEIVTAAT